MKKLLNIIKVNITEIYLGTLLFLALPLTIASYLDWRAALISSILFQCTVIILYVVRNK